MKGLIPPAVSAPCFVIRKPATKVFSLADFVTAGTLSQVQAQTLREAVTDRLNIVIAGGTASGKTTFANALLKELEHSDQRVLLIEDIVELQCRAPDHMQLRSVGNRVTMRTLVRSALRLRPDRIIIGEVRGGEALDLLKAWNTGHPGGITTIHANDALSALSRIEQLVAEVSQSVSTELIAQTIDLIIHLEKTNTGRRVTQILRVTGTDRFGVYETMPAAPPSLSLVASEEILS